MQTYHISKDTKKEQFANKGMKEKVGRNKYRSTKGRKQKRSRKGAYQQNVFGSASIGSGR